MYYTKKRLAEDVRGVFSVIYATNYSPSFLGAMVQRSIKLYGQKL